MSMVSYGAVPCPVCNEPRRLTQDGSIKGHRYNGARCAGSLTSPDEPTIDGELIAQVMAAVRTSNRCDRWCVSVECHACSERQVRDVLAIIEPRVASIAVRRVLGRIRHQLRNEAEAGVAAAQATQRLTYPGGLRRAVRLVSAAYEAEELPP